MYRVKEAQFSLGLVTYQLTNLFEKEYHMRIICSRRGQVRQSNRTDDYKANVNMDVMHFCQLCTCTSNPCHSYITRRTRLLRLEAPASKVHEKEYKPSKGARCSEFARAPSEGSPPPPTSHEKQLLNLYSLLCEAHTWSCGRGCT